MARGQMKNIGLRVPAEIHDKMAYIAEYEGRTLSGQIYFLMKSCIREFEKTNGEISQEDMEAAK